MLKNASPNLLELQTNEHFYVIKEKKKDTQHQQ